MPHTADGGFGVFDLYGAGHDVLRRAGRRRSLAAFRIGRISDIFTRRRGDRLTGSAKANNITRGALRRVTTFADGRRAVVGLFAATPGLGQRLPAPIGAEALCEVTVCRFHAGS